MVLYQEKINKSTISRHINNIYDNNELLRISAVAKNATVQLEGEKHLCRKRTK